MYYLKHKDVFEIAANSDSMFEFRLKLLMLDDFYADPETEEKMEVCHHKEDVKKCFRSQN